MSQGADWKTVTDEERSIPEKLSAITRDGWNWIIDKIRIAQRLRALYPLTLELHLFTLLDCMKAGNFFV